MINMHLFYNINSDVIHKFSPDLHSFMWLEFLLKPNDEGDCFENLNQNLFSCAIN